jgi:hypothetical protein
MFPVVLEKIVHKKHQPPVLWGSIGTVFFVVPFMIWRVVHGWSPLQDVIPGVWGKVFFVSLLVTLCILLLIRGARITRPYNQ